MAEQRLLAYGQMIGELWLEWCDNSTSTLNKQILMGETEDKSEGIPDIVDFTRQRLGFDPNPLQELALRGGRRGIVNCTRQWGKSTGGGGEGSASRLLPAGQPNFGAGSQAFQDLPTL
jgi:hypothetical protein